VSPGVCPSIVRHRSCCARSKGPAPRPCGTSGTLLKEFIVRIYLRSINSSRSLSGGVMAEKQWRGLGMAALAWGYFLWYVPYSGLTKLLSSGRLLGGASVSGLELLPATALGALAGMPIFLGLSGWWRLAHRWRLFGFQVPGA